MHIRQCDAAEGSAVDLSECCSDSGKWVWLAGTVSTLSESNAWKS